MKDIQQTAMVIHFLGTWSFMSLGHILSKELKPQWLQTCCELKNQYIYIYSIVWSDIPKKLVFPRSQQAFLISNGRKYTYIIRRTISPFKKKQQHGIQPWFIIGSFLHIVQFFIDSPYVFQNSQWPEGRGGMGGTWQVFCFHWFLMCVTVCVRAPF